MNKMLKTERPPISVVVIGLNVAQFLPSCLQAIRNSNYPQDKLEIIYADSGSNDGSQQIAQSFEGVRLVELETDKPSAAKGRNLGAQVASHTIIQFVDADSYLHPEWLGLAVDVLNDEVAAVAGSLRERFPRRNLFHRMADLEWNLRVGPEGWTTQHEEARTFGGNVMLQAATFKSLNGYDELLVAGEDPDLSFRLRMAGKKIFRLNTEMASHDINLSSVRQFLKRTRRSGYAYGQLAWRYFNAPERYMLDRVMRILVSGTVPLAVAILGLLSGYSLLGISLALIMAFRLVFKTGKYADMFKITRLEALTYSLYLTFAIYPQYLGLLKALKELTLKKMKAEPSEMASADEKSFSLNTTK